MTIDKNYNPLNPMVGQVKQFLDQKNIPKEQVVPFLMSLGYPGLAGAVAGRMRLDQASEGIKALQQGQNAAPPTVVQENAQNAQQMQQQMGQAMAQPPQQPGPINMAGGGIVAFSNGSTVSGQGLGGATWGELEDMFNRSGPEERARILDRLRRENPKIAQYLERGIKALGSGDFGTGMVSKTLKKLPYVSAGEGVLGIAGTTAEDLQRSSRLAQLGMNVDPNSYLKTFGAGLAGLAEEALPTSFFYETPVDRAQKASDVRLKSISNRTGIQSNLSDADKQQANAYAEIVRQFGSDSQEARDFEAQYRQGMGRATPEGEDELARLLAQSAASSQAAPAGGEAAGFRLPGVSFQTGEMKAAKELRDRLAKLPGAEDFADPNKRQALIDREMAVKMEQYTKMGLFKPYDEAKEKVSGRLKELEGIKDKNFYKAMALMGFTMAGTKGSFFEALAAGGAAGISAYETFEERRQATLDKLQDRMMNIDMSIAGLKERAGTAASSRIDNLEQQKSNIENQITSINASAEQLQRTQSGQLAIAQMQIAADAARDKARFGGLPKDIERDIAKVREILENPALSSQGRQAAEAKLRALYDELSRATQAGSGSYQSALVRAMSNQIPGLTPQSEEGGGWGELTVR